MSQSASQAAQPFGKSVRDREKRGERFSEVRSKYCGILPIGRDGPRLSNKHKVHSTTNELPPIILL